MGPLRTAHTIHRLATAASVVVASFCLTSADSAAAESATASHSRKAIVLDVGRSSTGTLIPHAQSDADKVASLLEDRYGFDIKRTPAASPQFLENTIWRDLNHVVKADSNGQVIVYFRGYLRVENGTVWLTAVDSRGKRTTANSFNLRDLTKRLSSNRHCSLTTIILDAVSDADPGELENSLQTTTEFNSHSGSPIAVLAALTSESTPVREELGQSELCYWLVDALRGSALSSRTSSDDSVPDLKLASLKRFLMENLSDQCQLSYVSSPSVTDTAVVTPARHRTLDELITDVGKQTATQLSTNHFTTVVIPDIDASQVDDSEIPGQSYGPLLRYINDRFKAQLSRYSYGSFGISETMFVRDILNSRKITPRTLRGPLMEELFNGLQDELGSQTRFAILLVTLEHNPKGSNPAEVSLRCNAVSPSGDSLNQISGSALLNDSEWSMIGYSAVNQEVAAEYLQAPLVTGVPAKTVSTTRIDPPVARLTGLTSAAEQSAKGGNAPTRNSSRQSDSNKRRPAATIEIVDFFEPDDIQKLRDRVRQMQQDSTRENPLLDPDFPWRIFVKTEGERLVPEFSDDKRHAYVSIPQGRTYSIGIENRAGKPVFLRLLVDGLNTLPDRPLLEKRDKFEAAVKDSSSKLLPAQHVSLTNARAWYCEGEMYEVRGFFTSFENGGTGLSTDASLRQFVVTDARSSEAATQGYFKDIGIITAAFYEPVDTEITMGTNSGNGAVAGTRLGKELTEKVEAYRENQTAGRLLGVVHLRYGIPKDSLTPEVTVQVQ